MAPRFSVIVVAGDTASPALDSLAAQTSSDWEVCRTDRGDPDDLNEALANARGDFVAVLDGADTLAPSALAVIEQALSADPTIDFLYTDESLSVAGAEPETFLKPDWSPERLRSQHYTGQLAVFRRAVLDELGGFHCELAGAHDLALRVAERTRRIRHVPAVLCTRVANVPIDDVARRGRRRAVAEHLERLSIRATVEDGTLPGTVRVRRLLPNPPPRVSVVIPTAGIVRPVWGIERVLVETAVRSVVEVSDHPDVEVVVVADPQTPPAVTERLSSMGAKVIEGAGAFSYSRRCNQGVAASSGEHVVLLNDDILVEQPDWLTVQLGFFTEPDVGVVGARLLYADGTLQHAGVLLNEHPMHIYNGFAADEPGPFGLLQIDREVGAVTGACLATTRAVWDEMGGLSEDFAVAFNDVDFCLRVRASGRRVIWTPYATLYHFESQSRGHDVDQREIDLMFARWDDELRHDPYGNPSLEPRQGVWLSTEDARRWQALRRLARRLVSR
jgi:GT2 family glycosyltransferase